LGSLLTEKIVPQRRRSSAAGPQSTFCHDTYLSLSCRSSNSEAAGAFSYVKKDGIWWP